MRGALLAGLLSLVTVPAMACINDHELPDHEREFRSSYEVTNYEPPVERNSNFANYAIGGSGILLTVMAAMMTVSYRNRSR